jgi:hypothetical protein
MIKAAIAVLLAVAAGASAGWWLHAPGPAGDAAASDSAGTATVVRTTLTTTSQLSGTLGYVGSEQLIPRLPGTLTALPAPGTVIRRGQPIYELDGAGVYLGYGSRPAWRPFAIGMTPGADVRELEANLVALGYGNGLAVDDTFTWATRHAVSDWQLATGQPVTGTVELGRMTFAPGPLRIVSDDVPLGSAAQPDQPVLTASSPQPIVTMPVPATQTYLVHRGDRVSVTLPSGRTSPGRVVGISSVASAPTDSGQSNGPNGPPQASVPALVQLDDPAVAVNLDQAPVTIAVTDRRVTGVLAVPVTALVALAGGGYAVWVDAGTGRHLVPVTPGLFADTLVQVTATGLRAGDQVEVPAA